jgi:hypothetical protein
MVSASDRYATPRFHRDWILPMVLIGIGWLLRIGLPMYLDGASFGAIGAGTLNFIIHLAIAIPLGIVGLIIAYRLFDDDAGELPLAVLRLAAVFAITFALLHIIPLFPSPRWNRYVYGFIACVMAGLIAWLFEWDFGQGLVVTVFCSLAAFAALILLNTL